ncbi:MAG: CHAT domain-containing protein, partial [candidate division KSB1 bacterium]|nr:CHAT domain-containing protein [candidate division KSB1 bacterium]
MIITQKINLDLNKKQIQSLKDNFQQIIHFIEQGKSLSVKTFFNLQQNLSALVAQNQELMAVLAAIKKTGEFYHINLCHPDSAILNLPWGLAIDPHSGHELYRVPQLFLSRTSCADERPPAPALRAPLKILVMISAPLDLPQRYRLNYEDEELSILKSFAELKKSGQVQIDFTENGSLFALRQKIDRNDYHILHFSGHGNYDEKTGIGTLLLEDDLTLTMEETDGAAFATALLKPGHKIPLVVLSSCKTSQGNFAGVAASLLQKGIPGVVAMGMSIVDAYATAFTAHFYKRLADRKTVLESFQGAVEYIRSEPFNDEMKKQNKYAPLQWLIPNLYLNQELPLVDWTADQPLKSVPVAEKLFVNQDLAELEEEKDLFIGRRADLAATLPKLFDRTPIVLHGVGGIGKTRFARKLVQRRKAHRPDLVAFAFHYQDEG